MYGWTAYRARCKWPPSITSGDPECTPAPTDTLLLTLETTEALLGRAVGSCVACVDAGGSLCWLTEVWVEGLAGHLHPASHRSRWLQLRLAKPSNLTRRAIPPALVTCPSTAAPSSVKKLSSCLKIPSSNSWPLTSVTRLLTLFQPGVYHNSQVLSSSTLKKRAQRSNNSLPESIQEPLALRI